MKRVTFVPSTASSGWLRTLLPGVNPAELPLAGARYVDYALEWAEMKGYEEAVLLDCGRSAALAAEFAKRPKGAFRAVHRPAAGEAPQSPDQVDAQGGDLVFGLELAGMRIDSVPAWHAANMALLGGGEIGGVKFVLPGYSAEPGVFIRRNVGTERGFEAKTPLLLQDGAWCARDVRLDGFCAIGRRSFVGARTRLERTVVGDDTYVGTDLEFVDKIIIGHRVFDAVTGAWTDIGERGVAGALRRAPKAPAWLLQVVAFLRGRSSGRRR